MQNAKRPPSWQDWFTVFACLVCQIGMGVGAYVLPVFLKPVVNELGWSRTEFAIANPIMSTVVALVGPLVGWISDRRGPRLVLIAGSVLVSVAMLGAGRMETHTDLYVVAVLIGTAVACLGDLPTGAAIAGRFHQYRGLAFGLVYIGSNLGGAAVPLLATALAAGATWRHAFGEIGTYLWIILLPLALCVRRSPVGERATHEAEEEAEGSDVATSEAIRERDFWLLFWVLFVFYLYRLGINVHLVAYLSDLGYSSEEAAVRYSLTLAIGIVGKLCVGIFADRVGAKAAVVTNFTIIAAASMLLLLPSVPGGVILFLVLHGFATAAEDVVMPLIVGQRFGVKNLGRIYGLLLIALVPGGTIGPVLAGRVFDVSGSYAFVFAVFVLTNLSAVLALALVRTKILEVRQPPRTS
jgi:MFS family permease